MANNQMKHPALNENPECAKKVISDSLGLVDFAIWLVNSVLNLPEEQVKFFKKFKLQKNCNQSCLSKIFWASTYQQQLARMASHRTDFLCTLASHKKHKPINIIFCFWFFLISIFLATQEHVRDTCGVQGFVSFTIIYHLSLFFKIIIF